VLWLWIRARQRILGFGDGPLFFFNFFFFFSFILNHIGKAQALEYLMAPQGIDLMEVCRKGGGWIGVLAGSPFSLLAFR